MSSLFDPLYYAVSATMWFWHHLVGAVLGPASGAAWALAVVLLVVTLRALLVRPALGQLRTAAVLRRLGPELTALRTRHRDDPARLMQETTALHREHGVSTWGTLLPALVQVPVVLGLLHVVEGFRDPAVGNYAFGPDEVASFLAARLFGVPLSAYVGMSQQLLDAVGIARLDVVLVALPIMLIAAVATHLTARHAAARQPAADGPVAVIQRWSPWVGPLGLLVAGLVFPFSLGVLIYWLTSNLWTAAQQWFGYRWVDRVEPVRPAAADPSG